MKCYAPNCFHTFYNFHCQRMFKLRISINFFDPEGGWLRCARHLRLYSSNWNSTLFSNMHFNIILCISSLLAKIVFQHVNISFFIHIMKKMLSNELQSNVFSSCLFPIPLFALVKHTLHAIAGFCCKIFRLFSSVFVEYRVGQDWQLLCWRDSCQHSTH